MAKMRAFQFSRTNGPLESTQREVPEARAGFVRVKVQACGVCHSDLMVQTGAQFPRVPGHEVAGIVDAVGPGVAGWKVGQRVGVGWNGG
jgi:D-arabinose 1-dehydrogenase-like Zn-dependent alcohol dehydrogenase